MIAQWWKTWVFVSRGNHEIINLRVSPKMVATSKSQPNHLALSDGPPGVHPPFSKSHPIPVLPPYKKTCGIPNGYLLQTCSQNLLNQRHILLVLGVCLLGRVHLSIFALGAVDRLRLRLALTVRILRVLRVRGVGLGDGVGRGVRVYRVSANFMSCTPARVWGRCLCKCRINPQEKSMVDREFDDQPWDFGDKNMFFSELWWNYLCEFYGFWGYPMCQASGVPLGKESTDFVKHWIFEVPIRALCLGKTIFRRPDSSDWNWKIWAKTTKLNNIYIYINNWFTVHGLPTTHI